MKANAKHLITAAALMTVLLTAPTILLSEDIDGATGAVTFEPNFPSDSKDASGSAKSIPFIAGNTVELPTKMFSCGNYILTGWGTAKNGGTTYAAGGDYPVKSGTATLYAQWTSIRTDGGNNHFDTEAPSTAAIGKAYSYTPLSNYEAADSDIGRLYYWEIRSLKSEFSVRSCPSWLNISLSKGTLTCTNSPSSPGNYYVEIELKGSSKYVFWTINVPSETDSSYTISYDLNGGSGSKPASTTGIYAQGVTLSNAFVGSTEISKSGYTLGGWDIEDRFGTVSTYPLGAQYGLYKDVTAKAHWVADPNVIVFSMDGGSLENVKAYVTSTGGYYSLPTSSEALKDGCTLIGWHVTGDSQAVYAPGFLVEISGSLKLEAHYVTQSQMSALKTVTYDYCGGTGPVYSQYIERGGFVYLPDAGCERSGHSFQGWSLTDGGEVINTLSYEITSDTKLYAVWKDNSDTESPDPERWTVIFDSNGGNTSVPAQTVTDKGFAVRPGGVTKEGHILSGWYSTLLNRNWDFGSDQVTQDMVLRAQWDTHFTYAVSGLHVTVTIDGIYAEKATVNWGDGTTTDTVSGTAEHDYAGSNSSSRIVVSSYVGGSTYTSILPLSGLEEHHVPIARTCKVTFDTAEGIPDTWTVTVDRLDPVSRPDDPTKEGCTFLGWFLSGTEYRFTDPVESDLYLIAKWRNDSSGEVDPDPVIVYPVANGTVVKTETGYRFDGTGSANAQLYKWYLSGDSFAKILIGEDPIVEYNEPLEPGMYLAQLVVTSSTGHTSTDNVTFNVQTAEADDDKKTDTDDIEDKDWFEDNIVLIAVLAFAVIGIVAARFLI